MADGKEKKPIFKRVWFWILVIIVVAAIAGAASGGNSSSNDEGSDTSTTEETATEESTEEETEDYSVTDEELVVDTYSAYVEGTLTNNTDKDLSYVQVTYVFYDADGNQLDSGLDNTNDLKAGGTWKFEAMALVDDPSEVASYELTGIDAY